MSGAKEEFPPLLQSGLHEMTLQQLESLCVSHFPLSTRRPSLMVKLNALIASISNVGIVAEIWVNGSFLTEKVEPNDTDLAVRVDALNNEFSNEQFEALERVKCQGHESCDSYVFYEFPEGHSMYADSEKLFAYWRDQFGRSRGGQPKGIALIRVPLP